MRASEPSHASQHGEPCESTFESHSYQKLTVIKGVLKLNTVYQRYLKRVRDSHDSLARRCPAPMNVTRMPVLIFNNSTAHCSCLCKLRML